MPYGATRERIAHTLSKRGRVRAVRYLPTRVLCAVRYWHTHSRRPVLIMRYAATRRNCRI
eukprot:2011575-Rhodomonas_salina.1